jgi:hypothetical protein
MAHPLTRRVKQYSSESGIVYEYIFSGREGNTHIFSVSADRQPPYPLGIELTETALAHCRARLGSDLRWNDEYALAKLSLFAAFDAAPSAAELPNPVRPSPAELIGYMKTLKMVEDDE